VRASTTSGLPALGELPWGSHLCHFYRTAADLAETLVPFFRAGLERNEQCLWVTSAPLPSAEARAALGAAVPGLARRLEARQIEIVDHRDWYEREGAMDTDGAVRGWVRREADALAGGYAGLRLTGNTAWLERSGWDRFMEYEERVATTFATRRVVGLCSYPVDRCGPEDVLEVVRHHDLALARRDGAWEPVERAALAASKAEPGRASEELEERVRERTAELSAALRGRDEFLSVASHELRTPLTALQLALAGVQRGRERGVERREEEGRRLARALEQTQRLSVLVDELLDVARARTGALALAPTSLDAAALAREVAERLAEPLARAGCALAVDAPAAVPGRWDPRRLEQVLVNLLSNAARHAPGAPVELAVRPGADGGARLEVRDHGPGVAPEHRSRVFEPFSRLDPSRGGGLGLGLWIVRRIVEAHGGTIDLGETPGGGAAFVVSLPATPARARGVAVVSDGGAARA
jgi:signal transduction histidine kinase